MSESTDVPTRLPRSAPPISIDDAARALQSVPYGGSDDGSLGFAITPALRASISPMIAALRWSTAMFGVLYAAPKAQDGDLAVVVSTTVCLFVASWRTVRPLRLDSPRLTQRILAHTDAIIVGGAVGVSNGLVSPFAFCVLAVAVVGAFGWGLAVGTGVTVVALVALVVTAEASNAAVEYTSQPAVALLAVIVASVVVAALARRRLLTAERRRMHLAGRVEQLAETNDLLQILNHMARSLPTALDGREAVASVRSQLTETFAADALLVLGRGEGDTWTSRIADGVNTKPSLAGAELPTVLDDALAVGDVLVADDLRGSGLSPDSGSGLYAPLATRGRTVGLVAIEARDVGRYGPRDERLLRGLCEVIALTLDNARWFGRLRTLGAEEERSRIARDLHDRLGQWLTYISFELERIGNEDPDPQILALRDDVSRAIDELRDTLRQLRMSISDDLPLVRAGAEVVAGFAERTHIAATFVAAHPSSALTIPVENELLRILLEALHNIDKHARATRVEVTYDVSDRAGSLVIRDDGRGFDPERGVRGSAYGLVGMRERADVIDATFTLVSAPGEGTTITVDVPREATR